MNIQPQPTAQPADPGLVTNEQIATSVTQPLPTQPTPVQMEQNTGNLPKKGISIWRIVVAIILFILGLYLFNLYLKVNSIKKYTAELAAKAANIYVPAEYRSVVIPVAPLDGYLFEYYANLKNSTTGQLITINATVLTEQKTLEELCETGTIKPVSQRSVCHLDFYGMRMLHWLEGNVWYKVTTRDAELPESELHKIIESI